MTAADTTTTAPSKPVSDGPPWLLVAVIAGSVVVDVLVGTDLTVVVLMANVVICLLDVSWLKQAGYSLSFFWSFLIPVYLWKRAALLGRSQLIFWVWLLVFGLNFAVIPFQVARENRKIACGLVTDLLAQQGPNSPACRGLTIVDDPGTGFVKARALLSDGSDRTITIEEQGDSISVQLLPQ